MSSVVSLFAWAASLISPGIQDERAVFIEQQSQIGHLYDTPENFTAAFDAFAGTNVAVAASPSAPSATTVPSSLAYINVKDPAYGAKGDGVTDDTLAIQTAYAAAAILQGAVVYFPPGTYVISSALVVSSSYIVTRGAGHAVTRLKWASGAPWTTQGMLFHSNLSYYDRVGNDILDITFDANGQGGSVLPAFTPLVWVGTHCTIRNVEACNRPGNASTPSQEDNWYFWIGGHDVTVIDCFLHDDYAPILLTTAMPSGTGAVSIPVASSTGLQVSGNLVIDPSVAVYNTEPVSAAGSVTVTPHTAQDNLWPNGGVTTGMRGIFVGQSLSAGAGSVLGVSVSNGGTGFTNGTYQNVPFTGGAGGNGGSALATVVVSGGAIQNTITITRPGSGNTTLPSLNLSGLGGGSGAVLTVSADLLETVTVTATTNSQWTATFATTHPANFPASYMGNTETAVITSIPDGTHVNVTLQKAHTSATCAVLAYPWTSDGIGIGNNQPTSRPTQRIQILNSRFTRLGLDGAGWATSKYIAFQGNTVTDCIIGCIPQDSSCVRIIGNTFDQSGLGLTPLGVNYNAITLYGMAPDYALVDSDIIIMGNTCIGGSYGLYAVPQTGLGIAYDGLNVLGNTFKNQNMNAIVLTAAKNVAIAHNQIRNANQSGRAVDPVGGGSVGAILVVATAGQPLDAVQMNHNNIVDTQNHLAAGVVGVASGGWNNVSASRNTIEGVSGQAVQYTPGFKIKAKDNPGYNPRKLVDPSSLAVFSPAMGNGSSLGVAKPTAQLAAPAQPVLSATPATGGAATPGVYTVGFTYVNSRGETTGSTTQTVTLAAGNELTATAPGASGDATGYYAWVSQAGGSTLYRQQAAGSPLPVTTNFVMSANPVTTNSSGMPTTNTSGNYVNVSGVDIMLYVSTSGGSGIAPTVDTLSFPSNGVGQMIYVPDGSVFSPGPWSTTQPVYTCYGL